MGCFALFGRFDRYDGIPTAGQIALTAQSSVIQ
jgi:hypothetical protein